jgi:RNA polymerase sigma-70 factor (ECF subfamily)
LTRNDADAEDVTQKAYMVVWKKREHIPENAWPWLAGIIINTVRSFRRKEARVLTSSDADRISPTRRPERPDNTAERNELRERLFAALHELPPEEQEAVALCHVTGLTFAEASAASGIRLGTLKTRVRRGIERMRRRLKPQAASLEALMGVALVPPPEGGWHAAVARWEKTAATSVVAGASAGLLVKVLAAVALASATVAVAWVVLDPVGAGTHPRPQPNISRVAATPGVSPSSAPTSVGQPVVELVSRPIVPPEVPIDPAAPQSAVSKVAAKPEGALAVGSTRN